MHTLYICYFGLREPLVQTQVLPYLRQLMRDGVEVTLLTFEPELGHPPTIHEFERAKAKLDLEGIHWQALRYHKRPSLPATLYDIAAGARLAARLVRTRNINVIHARNHVAAAMALTAKRLAGGRFLFDIRGFMPEEYADAGIWPSGGYLFRLTKAAERRLLAAADAFVVLTEKARQILFPGISDTDSLGRPVEVIPCCVDLDRFQAAALLARDDVRRELNLKDRRVFVYVGALGGWYLTEEMAEFLAQAHSQDPKTFSLVLTQSPPEMITERLSRLGIAGSDYRVLKVAPSEIPRYLKAADVAISFIKPCYSKLASSPTKIAEYLASGLPIISNSGIGDLDELLNTDHVGVLVREFNRDAYMKALSAVDELQNDGSLAERCRESARNRFDLEGVGGARYRRIYRRLNSEAQGAVE
jgi:glycosyltransferase involved in cell wall biosynthesis